jgi:hypothetical protein
MLRITAVAILCLLIFGRCAQQVAPTGGKKDTIAPNLVQSIPLNKTLNFKDNRIELFFDEYVILDNITQKLIITPSVENPYTFKQNGMSVVLNFKKKFADSTTYTLNFGDAIKDFAEKNPAKNLKLVFSTGNSLDSGKVYGNVKDMRSSKPLFDALVGLYNLNDTLDVAKQKPLYFSRTDSSGNFSIENVQINKYKLIAIDDKNRNMLYNTKDERVGFLENPVDAGSDSTVYTLNMFQSDITPLKIQRTIPKVNNYTIVFNKAIDQVKVSFPNNDTLPFIHETSTQLKFFNVLPHPDTTLINISVLDSLGNTTELSESKVAFQTQRGKERQRDAFTMSVFPETGKPLSNEFTYRLTFNKPIKHLDDKKILLITDSLTHEDLNNIPYEWNHTHNILSINAKSAAKDSIKWEFPKGSIISVEGDTLARTFLKHPLQKEEDYGQLRGSVLNADTATHFIVELVDEQYKVFKQSFESPFTFRHIPQGKYYLRLIVDKNRNKRWDSGDISAGRQPEQVIYLPEKMLIKSNFELNDINISLPKENN